MTQHTYLHARWIHAPAGCPIDLYSELDHARWETRKVEVFPGPRFGHASRARPENGSTRLSVVPLPSIQEIAAQIEFEVTAISAEQFEAVWQRAVA